MPGKKLRVLLTATPKKETLELYGTRDGGFLRPFHTYTVKDAISSRTMLSALDHYSSAVPKIVVDGTRQHGNHVVSKAIEVLPCNCLGFILQEVAIDPLGLVTSPPTCFFFVLFFSFGTCTTSRQVVERADECIDEDDVLIQPRLNDNFRASFRCHVHLAVCLLSAFLRHGPDLMYDL